MEEYDSMHFILSGKVAFTTKVH